MADDCTASIDVDVDANPGTPLHLSATASAPPPPDPMGPSSRGLWFTRRVVTVGSLIYFAALGAYVVVRGHDSVLDNSALAFSMSAYVMVTGAFLGLSTWHDVAGMNARPGCDR